MPNTMRGMHNPLEVYVEYKSDEAIIIRSNNDGQTVSFANKNMRISQNVRKIINGSVFFVRGALLAISGVSIAGAALFDSEPISKKIIFTGGVVGLCGFVVSFYPDIVNWLKNNKNSSAISPV